jgi:hypothetical protein
MKSAQNYYNYVLHASRAPRRESKAAVEEALRPWLTMGKEVQQHMLAHMLTGTNDLMDHTCLT